MLSKLVLWKLKLKTGSSVKFWRRTSMQMCDVWATGWQGRVWRAQATAFHASGRHCEMLRTGSDRPGSWMKPCVCHSATS